MDNVIIVLSHMYRIDPYTKKDWYDVKAPVMFTERNIGKTLVTRTQGKSECYGHDENHFTVD